MTTSVETPTPPAKKRGFASGYVPRPGEYDEMVDADGSLRDHWRMFVNMLDDLGAEELTRRWERARRLIHDNGVTHNVYGDPNGLDRPWNLDLAPLLIPAAQWDAIGIGLTQRAVLLNKLLADIHGPARCLTDGVIPPELLYANPAYLRACYNVAPPAGIWLHLYAADFARAPDGKIYIITDRTQAPSGAGYTLENRIVISRSLPNMFRTCNVQRLAPFFLALRQTLASLAPGNRENPRVVVLTPGPYNETYFEHAYLARYLGYALVQGNDLTVRDCKVYLKTLSGLHRVDVILRRVDDDFCDSLELYPNSSLGVPGLLESVRQGNVAVANAIGSGIAQTPAFLPFLPRLCRYYLGEDLKIPSAPTWWCGEAESLRYVRDNLPSLVVKSSFPQPGSHPIFCPRLSKAELSELRDKIVAAPDEYIAQQQVIPSNAPILFNNQTAQSRHLVVRGYLVASKGSYQTMAGALTRVTDSSDSLVVSLQKGGGSKDTWILSDGPVSEVTLLAPSTQPLELSRGGGDLPSRAADDLYWLGRYVQRSESLVRTARGTLARLMDQSGVETSKAIRILAGAISGRWTDGAPDTMERSVMTAIFSNSRAEGLRGSIGSVYALARTLRDRISTDAWRVLQTIENKATGFAVEGAEPPIAAAYELLSDIVTYFAAFSGLALDSMTRGQSWRFLDLGQRIERALAISRLLRATLVDAESEDASLLEAVLEIGDSSLTYRRRYLTQLEAPAVIDLLLADESNPRAVAFQVAAIDDHLAHLPRDIGHPSRSLDRQLTLRLRTNLRLVDLVALCKPAGVWRGKLDQLLSESIEQLAAINESITQHYFSHADVSRRLVSSAGESLP